jgi:dolichyl-phosphate-mannose--protein O-mannosyl transferase
MVALVVVAAGLRLWGLQRPGRIIFDERYYVTDARAYLEHGAEDERPAHPPLGKWVIAAGMSVAGDRPVGWRISNALLGTATVAAVAGTGRLLSRRWWPGFLAGLLVALDGLAFTGSRIGMLDASLTWWVTAAALLLAVDARRPGRRSRWPGVWRSGAGVLVGLAAATKWSGVLAIGAALLVAALTDAGGAPWRGVLRRAPGRLVVPLVVVPVLAYLACYGPWLASYPSTETYRDQCEEGRCGTGVGDRLLGLWVEHRDIVSFHEHLKATHPDRSDAWRWPLLDKPVLFYLERCESVTGRCHTPPGETRRILSLGSPALWWPALAALPLLVVVAVRRRWAAAVVPLAFAFGQWLPWLAEPKPGYAFYLMPAGPFAALGVALLCSAIRPRLGRALAVVLAVASVGSFLFWRPFLVGTPLTPDATELRAVLASWD